jgi:uncharacterized repeat protein (TIGR03803 family)
MSRNRKRLSTLGAVMLVVIIVMPVLTPGAWAQSKYKTLYKFSGGKDGKYPQAVLIFDQAGNLYGTTPEGGDQGLGTVFKLAPNADGSWRESVLYSFCSRTNCGDGAQPAAGLVFDQAGNLYGTTLSRGANDRGTVFKLAPNADGSWRESVLHSFCSLTNCGDGNYPVADLVFDQAGNLYGTTGYGGGANDGGTVFKLAPNADGSWRESVLHSFCSLTNCGDGAFPFANLIFDQAGNLYSTTEQGGAHSEGTVFKLAPNADGSWRESVLHSFCSRTNCGDGEFPLTSLIFDQAGNLYGTTQLGGAHGLGGTVFKLAPNADGSWRESVLHSFCSRTNCGDGKLPLASLIFDQAGNLYSTTAYEGDPSCNSGYGCGVVFKLVPNSNGGWKETVLHTFFDHPGAIPLAGVIFDPAGNLYGTSSGDGSTTFGSVFEITP